MNTFNLLNRARNDVRNKKMSTSAFYVLEWMLNTMRIKDTAEIKKYYKDHEEKEGMESELGMSQRQIERIFKKLSKLGYITIHSVSTATNKKPTMIRLSNEKSPTQVTTTSESPRHPCQKVPDTGVDPWRNTSHEHNMIEEVPGGPGDTWSGEKHKSKNDIVNEYKDKVNDRIRHLKSIKDRRIYEDVLSSISKLFKWADENKSLFSESQYNSFVTGYRSSVEKIVNGKERYFKGTRPSDDDTISDEPTEKTYDSQPSVKSEPQSDSSEKHLSWEEWLAWANKTLQNCPDYGAFDRQLESHINKVYGCSEWYSELKGDVSVRMSRIYNSLSRMADKHFNSSGNQPATKPYGDAPFNSIVTEAFK